MMPLTEQQRGELLRRGFDVWSTGVLQGDNFQKKGGPDVTESLAQRLVDVLNQHVSIEEVSATCGGELEYLCADFREYASIDTLVCALLEVIDRAAPEGYRAVVEQGSGFKLVPASALAEIREILRQHKQQPSPLTPEMVEQIHDDIYWEIHDDYTLSDEARAIAWRAIRQMADRLRQQMGGADHK